MTGSIGAIGSAGASPAVNTQAVTPASNTPTQQDSQQSHPNRVHGINKMLPNMLALEFLMILLDIMLHAMRHSHQHAASSYQSTQNLSNASTVNSISTQA